MKKVKVIRKGLPGFKGDAWLVQRDNEYFVISTASTPFIGPETLVFKADKHGNVTSMREVLGGHGVSHMDMIKQLEAELDMDW